MKGLYVHVQSHELLALQGTAVSQIKVTQRVRSQGQGFSLGSHFSHGTELPCFMDKQSRELQIKAYGMTQTLQTNSLLACVLWITAAQWNGLIALLQLHLHLHSWTNPFLVELLQQRAAFPTTTTPLKYKLQYSQVWSLDVLHHVGQNLI